VQWTLVPEGRCRAAAYSGRGGQRRRGEQCPRDYLAGDGRWHPGTRRLEGRQRHLVTRPWEGRGGVRVPGTVEDRRRRPCSRRPRGSAATFRVSGAASSGGARIAILCCQFEVV
jgi:hypothetical protein